MYTFLLIMTMMTPILMILIGLLWKKHPPKQINSFYGYRTARSMQSLEAWDYAHAYHAKVWLLWGGVLLLISLAAMILIYGKENYEIYDLVIVGIQIAVMLLSIVPTELALKKRFSSGSPEKIKCLLSALDSS